MSKEASQPIIYDILEPPVPDKNVQDIHELLGMPDTHMLDLAVVAQNVQEIVNSPNQHLYVAQHAGKIVGMAVVTEKVLPDERTAIIDRLTVPPAYRGLGVHRGLIKLVIEHADADDFSLETINIKRDSLGDLLFSSLGFNLRNARFFTRKPSV